MFTHDVQSKRPTTSGAGEAAKDLQQQIRDLKRQIQYLKTELAHFRQTVTKPAAVPKNPRAEETPDFRTRLRDAEDARTLQSETIRVLNENILGMRPLLIALWGFFDFLKTAA